MDNQLLAAISEIRDLLRLIAEPQIAARDKKYRDELIRIVGASAHKRKAVLAMNGIRSQSEIRKLTGMDPGNLSTFVKQLNKSKLLAEDSKEPKFVFPIPENLFDQK